MRKLDTLAEEAPEDTKSEIGNVFQKLATLGSVQN